MGISWRHRRFLNSKFTEDRHEISPVRYNPLRIIIQQARLLLNLFNLGLRPDGHMLVINGLQTASSRIQDLYRSPKR